MKLIKLAFITAAIVLFAVACNNTTNTNQSSNSGATPSPEATPTLAANANAKPSQDEFAHATEIYTQNCAICHGEKAEGGIVKTKDGKKLKVPSLVSGHALNHTQEQIAKKISSGGDGMPAFKDKLKPEEIDQAAHYVRQKLQGGATSSNTNTMPATPKK